MENEQVQEGQKVVIKGAADFLVYDEYGKYSLPILRVGDNGLEFTGNFTEIQCVRGNVKIGEEVTEKADGVTVEGLLAMLLFDLEVKFKIVPSEETFKAIEKLKEAQLWLMKRNLDRATRGVQYTYEK